MRMLDLFCGRGGWTNVFLDRGWEVTGVDIVKHPDYRGEFLQRDVLTIGPEFVREFDFVCASSPCEEFSVYGIKCFHPNPKPPTTGLRLFNHTKAICEESGVPYIMENVRSAQRFVGAATHHCGPFYLWGTGVPVLMAQGIRKGIRLGTGGFTGKGQKFSLLTPEEKRLARKSDPMMSCGSKSSARKAATALVATIPPELANCVADYAERILTDHLQTDVGQRPHPTEASSSDEL